MKNKLINLSSMVKLRNNEKVSYSYVKYLTGLDFEREYRHNEIIGICKLLDNTNLSENQADGYVYSYLIPQLNKEFDLLKITNNICINIELKGSMIEHEKIKKQLIQNKHYLKILNRKCYLFTYISNMNKLYLLGNNNELSECDISLFKNSIPDLKGSYLDLDEYFTPKNILISPLNSPMKFLNGEYLLTEHQTNIENKILEEFMHHGTSGNFYALTGGAGTGKTLLLYDIAKKLANTCDVVLIHCGILCDGHYELNSKLKNFKIVPAKELRSCELEEKIVLVDESHRIYKGILDKIEKHIIKCKGFCVFSYDKLQTLSKTEEESNVVQKIEELCEGNILKLTNKIRTNKELALFITCLRDLSKYKKEYNFKNVHIIFEPDYVKALNITKELEAEGYTYISYTPSLFDDRLNYQQSKYNTHKVIGQEFDKVCMILDKNFYYEGSLLKALPHPNPNYLYTKLLYQGLTRVRSEITLIICSEKLLEHILLLFGNKTYKEVFDGE